MTPATIDERVARLAPVGAPDPDRLDVARAAVLRRIQDPAASAPDETGAPARRLLPRLLPAAAAVAGLTAALLLWPSPAGDLSAYATWVPTPAAVTPGDAAAQKGACVESIWRDGRPDGAASPEDLTPVVAERRGDWLYTLLVAGERGARQDAVFECLTPLDGGPVEWSGWIGNVSADPGPTEAAWKGAAGGGDWRSAWGYVGADVRSVTITRWDGVELEATVADGYFAAWWPRPEGEGSEAAGFSLTWYLDGGKPGGTWEWPGA